VKADNGERKDKADKVTTITNY